MNTFLICERSYLEDKKTNYRVGEYTCKPHIWQKDYNQEYIKNSQNSAAKNK